MPLARQLEANTIDEEAMLANARLDPRAFAPLYDRYVDPIYRYCLRRIGDRDDAEDATSKVFFQALSALPRYESRSFRSWLFTIAHNVVADLYRARRLTFPLETAEWQIDPRPDPETSAIAADDGRAIRALLAQLSPESRELMELRLAGLTDLEIAHVVGRSHGAVRMAQHRTVVRLRELHASAIQAEGYRG
jgi:RNA polymerase sigma-70 factor (ECF subfamily)